MCFIEQDKRIRLHVAQPDLFLFNQRMAGGKNELQFFLEQLFDF